MNRLRRWWCNLRGDHKWSEIKDHRDLGRFVECTSCGHIAIDECHNAHCRTPGRHPANSHYCNYGMP